MVTWSGSFSNEEFTGPGTYQVKNGTRTFIDMKTVPGDVIINAIVDPINDSSFIIQWDNPDRKLLTLATDDNYENLIGVIRTLISSVTTRTRRGLVGFTFLNDRWEVFSLLQFGTKILDVAFVGWRGRSTNGLATLLPGDFNTIEVERTALAFYTIRFKVDVIVQGETKVIPGSVATGLPVDNGPEMLILNVGMSIVNEIKVNTGRRNKAGVFFDDDLLQDSSNFHAITLQQFP